MSKHYIASWRRQSWPSLPKVVLPLASLLNLCRSWLHCHQPICAKCYLYVVLQRNYYISIIAQAEGGDFHGSGRWFQGMQDLCKKYGMNVSKQYMIFSSLFNFHFLNIPLLPFRSQLIIDEVQTGGGATGRLREASQIVKKIIHNL